MGEKRMGGKVVGLWGGGGGMWGREEENEEGGGGGGELDKVGCG